MNQWGLLCPAVPGVEFSKPDVVSVHGFLGNDLLEMEEITASMVKDLRERSSAGMTDRKKALTKSGGDFDKAMALPSAPAGIRLNFCRNILYLLAKFTDARAPGTQ